MNPLIPDGRLRRALAPGVLAGFLLAAVLALAPHASAAATARVDAGTLTITGDGTGQTIVLRLEGGSPNTLQVDLGGDGTADFSFDRTTFTAIDVEAGGGNDTIKIDQSGGLFTDEAVTMNGGAGDDTLIGGAGADTLIGGNGDDTADGNLGADTARLGKGDDTFRWDPGDGSDTVDGEAGDDLLDFFGSNIGEAIDVSANGPRVRFFRNVAGITMDLGGIERVGFHAVGGADNVTVGDLAGTDTTTVDVDLAANGGGGDSSSDTVTALGTAGPDTVAVGPAAGGVAVTGLAATTRVTGAEATGDSVGVRTLGGADTITTGIGVAGPEAIDVDGGDDADTTRYDGTAGPDSIQIVSNGPVASTIGQDSSRVDTTAVESLVVSGLAGDDAITGTGNLAPLTALTIDGGAGDDTLGGGNGADTLIGGDGNDLVDGNIGADTAFLGKGDDTFRWDPGDGSDTVEGQTGTDTLAFNGSNIGEQIGISANGTRVRFTRNVAGVTMDLAGTERIAFRALGGADAVTVDDLAGTETKEVDVDLGSLGGGDGSPDTVTARGTDGPDAAEVGPAAGGGVAVTGLGATLTVTGAESPGDSVGVATLGGSDAISTGIGFAGPEAVDVDGGAGADTASYAGTAGDDTISVVSNGTEATTASGASRLDTTAVESLVVTGLDGADTIVGTGNLAPLTALTLDGGPGDDTLRGGNGADTLLGGDGNDLVDGNIGADTAFLGKGDDTFQWDPGDGSDTVEGQTGADTLDFNGSNIGEEIAVSANGPRVKLTRNVAGITMDLDGIEALAVRTLGGADTITIGDLTGTDLLTADLDLGSLGGGDASADTVVVTGTAKKDAVQVTRSGAQAVVSGLFARTRIAGSEPTLDTLRVETGAGDDAVTVAPDVADLIQTVVN